MNAYQAAAICSLAQEYNDALEEAEAAKAEAEEAFNATKVKVIEMLDDETKKILEQEFANSNKFLNESIEAKVWENKNKK